MPVHKTDDKRREILWLAGLSGGAAMFGPMLSGCAVDPVTGENTLVGLSESQEISIDKQQAPHQFSNDYGVHQNDALNTYMDRLGKDMAQRSHRPQMPYNFQVVNATYVNAYTFPAGSVAVTRGILAELDDEAELAALLGHEIGHVNARHAAERAGKAMIAQVAVAGATIAAASNERTRDYAQAIGAAGQIGASALLASYSRDNEREADALGMEYMTRAEYNPKGMVGLMGLLKAQSGHSQSSWETLFSSHPMSDERYTTAVRRADENYASFAKAPMHKDRFMDEIAPIRRKKQAIKQFQQGQAEMGQQRFQQAVPHLNAGLKQARSDYAGLVMMGQCQIGLENPQQAKRYFERAKNVYPQEAKAANMLGVTALAMNDYDNAIAAFSEYEQKLPGNPQTRFYLGYSHDQAGNRQYASQFYQAFLRQVQSGQAAQFAAQRLQQMQ